MDDWVNDKSFFGVSELEREVVAKDFFPPSNYNKHKMLSIKNLATFRLVLSNN